MRRMWLSPLVLAVCALAVSFTLIYRVLRGESWVSFDFVGDVRSALRSALPPRPLDLDFNGFRCVRSQ
ncbi:MAG: hypothetical protein KGS73_02010 [Chloroflexi bacterium]|nr:hypothetical protein [Chloroflexota bacterium]